jgi:hypothetical protein
MDKRLQAYLDGELERSALPAELRDEADRWDLLNGAAAELRSESAPAWLETRVIANLPEQVARPWWKPGLDWMFQQQSVSVRPASLAFAGMAAVAAILLLNNPEQPDTIILPVGPSAARPVANGNNAAVIYVQFAFANPNAKSVTVAGDFNDWNAEATALRDTDGDGVWTGMIALRPGMHKYMFVVDGEQWVTDPEAESYVDDGCGMRNAVSAITPPGRSI